MKSLILVFALLFASNAMAFECICNQTFNDHLGEEHELTTKTLCPETDHEAHLNCASFYRRPTVTTKCTDKVTGEFTKTEYKFNSWTVEGNSYPYCFLRSR